MEPAAQCASTRENSPGSDIVRIDGLTALSFDSMDRRAWPFFVDGVTCLVNSVSVCEEKRKRRERMKEKRREKMKER